MKHELISVKTSTERDSLASSVKQGTQTQRGFPRGYRLQGNTTIPFSHKVFLKSIANFNFTSLKMKSRIQCRKIKKQRQQSKYGIDKKTLKVKQLHKKSTHGVFADAAARLDAMRKESQHIMPSWRRGFAWVQENRLKNGRGLPGLFPWIAKKTFDFFVFIPPQKKQPV